MDVSGEVSDKLINYKLTKGGGAQQVNTITAKIQKTLPKDSPWREAPPVSSKSTKFTLTVQEAVLLHQMLLRIEVGVPETTAFLALCNPLEKALKKMRDGDETITIKLPAQGSNNLLIFMQRFAITGSQVKLLQGIMERLRQLQEQIEGASN